MMRLNFFAQHSCLSVCISLAAICSTCFASEVFSLSADKGLQLNYMGKPFITADRLDFATGEIGQMAAGKDFGLVCQPGKSFAFINNSFNGIIANGVTDNGVAWIREAAVSGDTVEISYALYIPPSDYGQDSDTARLKFYIPVEMLAGCEYECYVGMHRSGRPKQSGKLTGDEPNGKLFVDSIRHIQFKGKTNVYIDFCPVGVWGLYINDPAVAYKAHLYREGNNYVFILPDCRARYGARFLNKIVIREGIHDMDQIHVVRVLHYMNSQPVLKRIQFTRESPVKGFSERQGFTGWDEEFQSFTTVLYSPRTGMGWCEKPQGEMFHSPDKGMGPLLSNGFNGKGRAVFRIDHPDSLVIANVIFSGALGAYDVEVSANGSRVVKENVAADGRETVRIPCMIKDGKIEIAIEGKNWLLSGIVLQYLLGEEEDYQFNRMWWVSGKIPWTLKEFDGPDLWKHWPLIQKNK